MKDLLKLADLNTIARAKGLKVSNIFSTNNGVSASVEKYTASLYFDGSFSCSCPDFNFRRKFCKHLVALFNSIDDETRRKFLERKQNDRVFRIPTSIMSLNKLMGGGLPVGTVITIVGEPKAGKTFLSYQLSCEVSSLLRSPVVYIDTEGVFVEHVVDYFENFFSRFRDKQVIVNQIRDLNDLAEFLGLELTFTYKQKKLEVMSREIDSSAVEILKDLDAKMLVLDSLSYLIKTKMSTSSMQDYSPRATVLNLIYGRLDWISAALNIPVIVVQHISMNPQTKEFKIYGGPSMLYAVKYCLHVKKVSDEERVITRLIWPGKTEESISLKFKDEFGYVG